MDVGIRDLKAKLSSYVERAAAGEVITVTDRGRPVALLGPPLARIDLQGAVEAGWVSPASRTGLRPVARHRAAGSVLDALGEDRGE